MAAGGRKAELMNLARTLLANLRGSITMVLFVTNTIFWFIPILLVALLKLLFPVRAWQVLASRWLMAYGENWISFNKGIIGLTQDIQWDLRGLEDLKRREWYLVISNHRSWVDIVVLQVALNRRVPFLKFFIKQQLIWVPFLGLAWWAMDMPFMKRNPSLRGKDLEATRKACEKFRAIPTSVMNFIEGTRFTAEKHRDKQSPYENLLPPKSGGVGFVLGAMGGTLHALLDATIVYAEGSPSMWDLCCGRISRVVVDVDVRPIEPWLLEGDYQGDRQFRARFQQWLHELWLRKDQRIASIRGELQG